MFLIQSKLVFLLGEKIKVNIIQLQANNPIALLSLQRCLKVRLGIYQRGKGKDLHQL
jgi:hypothetical protein